MKHTKEQGQREEEEEKTDNNIPEYPLQSPRDLPPLPSSYHLHKI